MKKEDITKTARKLKRKYGIVSGNKLCDLLEVDVLPMYCGTGSDAINAFVKRNNRRDCILLNMDLSPRIRELVLYHEIGHVVMKHTQAGVVACMQLFARRETSVMEIEANEFAVEYIVDDEEVIRTFQETNSFFRTASLLRITPDMLYYKWRMLVYYGKLAGEPPILASSDCMGHLENDVNGAWEYGC